MPNRHLVPLPERSLALRTLVDPFLETLKAQAYAPATVKHYQWAVDRFVSHVLSQGLRVADLDQQQIAALKSVVVEEVARDRRKGAGFCIDRFLAYLIDIGAAQRHAPPVDDTPLGVFRREYDAYLRRQRGLADSSIYHCLCYLNRFVAFRFGDGPLDFNEISADDVSGFLLQLRSGPRPQRDRALPSHLRSLFKFLFWSGRTQRNLADAVPRMAQPKPTGLPKHLPPADVKRLIEAVRDDSIAGRRNYAMLLLIARLGLRAPEVIAAQLDDIDWRKGEILIRGKGGLHDRMPLPADVGDAIVDYIRHMRKGSSRALFVISRAPYGPFVDAQAVNEILQEAFGKTGLKPPQKYIGSHILRHSLATDLLRQGASLEEIGDVLRHRSRASTTIYAKHDVETLRSIARPWPIEGEVQ